MIESTDYAVTYTYDAATVQYEVPFGVDAATDVLVYALDPGREEDDPERLTRIVDAQVSLDDTVSGQTRTARVRLPSALAEGRLVHIRRRTPLTQTRYFPTQQQMQPPAVERALDKLTMQVQEGVGTAETAADRVAALREALTKKVDNDDGRLADARRPLPHAATHAAGGTDEITLPLASDARPGLARGDGVTILNNRDGSLTAVGGGGGTAYHPALTGRELPGQHPSTAITHDGKTLSEFLDGMDGTGGGTRLIDALDFRVAADGDDVTGDGSQAKPFATPEGCLSFIRAHYGKACINALIIRIGAGTFAWANFPGLAARINAITISGAGRAQTVLVAPDALVISGSDAGLVGMSDLTFDTPVSSDFLTATGNVALTLDGVGFNCTSSTGLYSVLTSSTYAKVELYGTIRVAAVVVQFGILRAIYGGDLFFTGGVAVDVSSVAQASTFLFCAYGSRMLMYAPSIVITPPDSAPLGSECLSRSSIVFSDTDSYARWIANGGAWRVDGAGAYVQGYSEALPQGGTVKKAALYVRAAGNDATGDGSDDHPFATTAGLVAYANAHWADSVCDALEIHYGPGSFELLDGALLRLSVRILNIYGTSQTTTIFHTATGIEVSRHITSNFGIHEATIRSTWPGILTINGIFGQVRNVTFDFTGAPEGALYGLTATCWAEVYIVGSLTIIADTGYVYGFLRGLYGASIFVESGAHFDFSRVTYTAVHSRAIAVESDSRIMFVDGNNVTVVPPPAAGLESICTHGSKAVFISDTAYAKFVANGGQWHTDAYGGNFIQGLTNPDKSVAGAPVVALAVNASGVYHTPACRYVGETAWRLPLDQIAANLPNARPCLRCNPPDAEMSNTSELKGKA